VTATEAEAGGTRELRLGVVCYGGSSLAIYMHGVTKELHRLVKGSALLDAELEPAKDALSETLYRDLLRKLADEQNVTTRVVVDVVAGTSAGGINGIYLTKAIARNRSLDGLRDVWFEKGDMKELLLLPKRLPVKLRFFLLLPRAVRHSPLRGNEMAQWLFGALEEMDDATAEPAGLQTLVPEDGRIDLFVTITDFYGYERQVPISRPHLVHDLRHRHALTFSYGPAGRDQFQRANNGSMAFAARATSCFPGVFPPVSFKAFREWVPKAPLDDLGRCFRSHTLAGTNPETSQFVDGGILDNRPFGWAVGAISKRRADVEVDRRLLYVEPDPAGLEHPEEAKPKAEPRTLAAILGAVSNIPRSEPILDDLLAMDAHNARVQRIRDVIETSFPGVTEFVTDVVGPAEDLPADAEDAKLAQWSKTINEKTIEEAGLSYATYLRMKISGAVDRYAETVCNVCDFPEDSNHAQLVRAVLRRWGDERGLFERKPEPTDAQRVFLRSLDLGYGERRLRFVTSALRWWYRDLRDGKPNMPPRADLDRGKTLLYDAVDKLRATMGGDDVDDGLRDLFKKCFPDEGIRKFLASAGIDSVEYVEQHRADLEAVETQFRAFVTASLQGSTARLYRDLNDLSKDWHPDRRRDLLVRYLGFPLWDVLLYPIQALADAGESDNVVIQRMSPYEARVLSTAPGEKVHGKKLMHFWAFFDRTARENDYLWGRLDGAVHLIGILLGNDHPEFRSWCLRAFAAILEEDEQALSHIPDTVRTLREEVARG
jgi:patatin-related protein